MLDVHDGSAAVIVHESGIGPDGVLLIIKLSNLL